MKHCQCFILNYHRQRIIDFGELQLFDRYADDFVIKKIIYMHPLIQALRLELVALFFKFLTKDNDADLNESIKKFMTDEEIDKIINRTLGE